MMMHSVKMFYQKTDWNTPLLMLEMYGSITGLIKLDLVSSTARHRCDAS